MSWAMRSTSASSCRQVASSFIRSLARSNTLYSSLCPKSRPSSLAFWSITCPPPRRGWPAGTAAARTDHRTPPPATRREAVGAAHQRLARLEQPHRRVEGGILRLRQIGRIRNDGTIALTCEGAKQIALAHLDRQRRLQERHVLAREGRRVPRALDRDHPLEAAFDRERQRDAAAPGTNVRDDTTPPASRIPHPGFSQHEVHESFGFRSRNQRPWVNLQVERAETRAARGVRERNAARALLHRVPELLQELRPGLPVASQPHVTRLGARTGHGRPQHRRLATRAGQA